MWVKPLAISWFAVFKSLFHLSTPLFYCRCGSLRLSPSPFCRVCQASRHLFHAVVLSLYTFCNLSSNHLYLCALTLSSALFGYVCEPLRPCHPCSAVIVSLYTLVIPAVFVRFYGLVTSFLLCLWVFTPLSPLFCCHCEPLHSCHSSCLCAFLWSSHFFSVMFVSLYAQVTPVLLSLWVFTPKSPLFCCLCEPLHSCHRFPAFFVRLYA